MAGRLNPICYQQWRIGPKPPGKMQCQCCARWLATVQINAGEKYCTQMCAVKASEKK